MFGNLKGHSGRRWALVVLISCIWRFYVMHALWRKTGQFRTLLQTNLLAGTGCNATV